MFDVKDDPYRLSWLVSTTSPMLRANSLRRSYLERAYQLDKAFAS